MPLISALSNSFTAKFHRIYKVTYCLFLLGFSGGSAGKESAWSAGDLGLIPGLGRSPGEGKGYPLKYSDLENSMDWIVYGVTKSWTRLSDFHFTLLTLGRKTSISHIIWFFFLVDMMNYIEWLLYQEPLLHPLDKHQSWKPL